MVTALPRPLLAAWNTFVLDEHARMAVPGMAVLYERLVTANPGAPVFYLSTGAWNVAPTLSRFLSRHLYPAGPLLLTDWGPTPDRWFRSGQEHKRSTLRRLAAEFPRHPVVAHRRRRPARPGDLLRVRARPPGKRGRGRDPPAVADPGGAGRRRCPVRPASRKRSARAARPGSRRRTGPGCGRCCGTPMSSELFVRLGSLGHPRVQPVPDLVRGVRPPPPFRPREHHARGRDARQSGQSHYLPPTHLLRIDTWTPTSASTRPST